MSLEIALLLPILPDLSGRSILNYRLDDLVTAIFPSRWASSIVLSDRLQRK